MEDNFYQGILVPILKILAFMLPYALIPLTFKFAGGIFATFTGMVDNKGKGLFDRAKQGRAHKVQRTMDSGNWLGTGKTGNAIRRVASPGSNFTRGGRANLKARNANLANMAAAKAMEADGGRSLADDDSAAVGIHADSGRSFVNAYADRMQTATPGLDRNVAEQRGREALARMETSLGVQVGSAAFRVASYKARAASSKGYGTDDAALKELYDDGASLANAGFMGDGDVAQAIKSNKTRADQSGLGYGQVFGAIANARNGGLDIGEVAGLKQAALNGSRAGEILGGHADAVTAMAPTILGETRGAILSGSVDDAVDNLAQLSGMHDQLGSVSKNHVNALDAGVLAQEIDVASLSAEMRGALEPLLIQTVTDPDTGVSSTSARVTGTITIAQAMEAVQSLDRFKRRKKVYGDQASAARAGAAAGPGPGAAPPVGP